MSCLQSVNKLSKNEVENVVNSIDYVFFDIDGVLVHNKTPINGAREAVTKLRKLGKKIAFVTNNSFMPISSIKENLKLFGATEDEIITPNDGTMDYLKKIDFKKDIYVIGCSLIKNLLKEAEYNVIDYTDIQPNQLLGENVNALREFSVRALDACKNVGAVLMEYDLNVSLGALQVAKLILNHKKDILLLRGAYDDNFNLSEEMKFIGAQFYHDGIKRWTKRKFISTGKPSYVVKDLLNDKFNIPDGSRVLFVGDNVLADIELGVIAGYQTLLVLTGITTKSNVENWKFPENLKPTYVAESINELYEKIKDF